MMDDRMFDGIRKKLEFLEEEAPRGLWEGIESALPPAGGKAGRPVRPLGWIWMPLAAAAAALAVFLLLPSREGGTEGPQSTSRTEMTAGADSRLSASEPTVWEEVRVPEISASAEGPSLGRDNKKPELLALAFLPSGRESAEEAAAEEETVTAPEAGTESPAAESEPQSGPEAATQGREPESSGIVYLEFDDADLLAYDNPDKRGRRNAFRPQGVRAGISGFMTQSRMESTFAPNSIFNAMTSKAPVEEDPAPAVRTTDRPSGETVLVQPYALKTDSKHYRPVTASVLARWKLTEALGIESGLSWTMLSSNFSTTSATSMIEDQQTLQYIGIPLSVSFSFFDTRRFSLYATMGGLVEKCIDGRVKHYEYVSDRLLNSYVDKISVKPFQWSVSAGAGLQANFTDNLGFFVEPCLSYHFKNDSEVATIYKERPLDFMVSLGLRFTINH
ncbi:MAG: outer membrane beta-barrel protein [Candidatus Cryptobacteroides sp.]